MIVMKDLTCEREDRILHYVSEKRVLETLPSPSLELSFMGRTVGRRSR